MKETLRKTGNGIGIAAPQVGILRRMIVIDLGEGPIGIINPVIIEQQGNRWRLKAASAFRGFR